MTSTMRGDETVGSVMNTSVLRIDHRATLRSAAAMLRDARVGTLLVCAEHGVAGILSERDVVVALADGADPDEVWVGDVMSEEPRYLTPGDTVSTALRMMLDAGVRHIPVIDECEPVGIVSIRDLAALAPFMRPAVPG